MRKILLSFLVAAWTFTPIGASAQTINNLGAGTTVTGSDLYPSYQGSNPAVSVTATQLQTFMGTVVQTGPGATGGSCTPGTTCTIATQEATTHTLTGSGTVQTTDAGGRIALNDASAATLTLENLTTGQFVNVYNEAAGTWTLSPFSGSIASGCTTVPQNWWAHIGFDGTNYFVGCGPSSSGGGSPGGSNTQLQYNNSSAFGGLSGVTGNGTGLTELTMVLGSDAKGDIYYNGGTSNQEARLGVGSPGNCLGVVSGVPAWGTGCGYPGFGQVSGYWYPGQVVGFTTAGNAFGASGSVYCSPYLVRSTGLVFKTFAIFQVSGDGVGSKYVSMALYNNDAATHRPGTLVDSIGSTGITINNTANQTWQGSAANTTDAVSPGLYWQCASSNSTTAVWGEVSESIAGTAGLLGAASNANIFTTTTFPTGTHCVPANCEGTPSWSGSTYVWSPDLSTSTWVDDISSIIDPYLSLQSN